MDDILAFIEESNVKMYTEAIPLGANWYRIADPGVGIGQGLRTEEFGIKAVCRDLSATVFPRYEADDGLIYEAYQPRRPGRVDAGSNCEPRPDLRYHIWASIARLPWLGIWHGDVIDRGRRRPIRVGDVIALELPEASESPLDRWISDAYAASSLSGGYTCF